MRRPRPDRRPATARADRGRRARTASRRAGRDRRSCAPGRRGTRSVRVGVAARDRDLEQLEAAALEPDVLDRRTARPATPPPRRRAHQPSDPATPRSRRGSPRAAPPASDPRDHGPCHAEQLDAEPGIVRLADRWREHSSPTRLGPCPPRDIPRRLGLPPATVPSCSRPIPSVVVVRDPRDPACRPPALPVSSFSLVARDLAVPAGRSRARRGRRRRRPGHPARGRRARTASGRPRCCASSPGIDRPDAAPSRARRRRCAVGYLPQEPERGRRDGARVPRAPHRRAPPRAPSSSAPRPRSAPGPRTDADDAYAAALDDLPRVGRPRLRRARPARVRRPRTARAPLGAPTATLSGGQAARASLAAILLSRFDVFLLDEPTNDLDFAGLARLEQFLDDLPGGVVVVSHDRAFLERTVTRVLELDEHTRSATEYGGGWQGYLDARGPRPGVTPRRPTRVRDRRERSRQSPCADAAPVVGAGRAPAKRAPRDNDKFSSATSASTRRSSRRPRPASARRRSTGSRRWRSRGRAGTCASSRGRGAER